MSGQRIIIAEDNLVMQDVMRYVLSAAGFQVTTAEEGTLALDLLEKHSADLLVTDCQMPGLSGIDLCRAIRRHPRFSDLPIVFCSAKGFEIPRETLQELGISDIICKPFSPRDLVRQVERALNSIDVQVEEAEGSLIGQPNHRDLSVTI